MKVADKVTLTRYATDTKAAKEMRQAASKLQASEVMLRACGQWIDVNHEMIDLSIERVPIREVFSVWVEANVHGRWIKLRPNSDPHLPESEQPRIEIEASFDV